jgi:hypothetical protein
VAVEERSEQEPVAANRELNSAYRGRNPARQAAPRAGASEVEIEDEDEDENEDEDEDEDKDEDEVEVEVEVEVLLGLVGGRVGRVQPRKVRRRATSDPLTATGTCQWVRRTSDVFLQALD